MGIKRAKSSSAGSWLQMVRALSREGTDPQVDGRLSGWEGEVPGRQVQREGAWGEDMWLKRISRGRKVFRICCCVGKRHDRQMRALLTCA